MGAPPTPMCPEDRALLRRASLFVDDPECFSPEDRLRLEQDLDNRLDAALAACTDDQLTPEELEAQRKGSW